MLLMLILLSVLSQSYKLLDSSEECSPSSNPVEAQIKDLSSDSQSGPVSSHVQENQPPPPPSPHRLMQVSITNSYIFV